MIVDYIDSHREWFGVEPICAVLAEAGIQVAPSTYYARSKTPLTDAELTRPIWPTPRSSVAGQLGGLRGSEAVACGPPRRPRDRPRPGGPVDEDRRDHRRSPRPAPHPHHDR